MRWTFLTEGPVLSSPAYARGTLYFGSSGGILYAVDAASGRELWRFATGSEITGAPVLGEGMVFFGTADGTLFALR